MDEHFDTIVIGAGQAGLAMGYHLAQHHTHFVILEGSDVVGGSWWHRWDSMRLFTPASHDSLPGMKITSGYFPDAATVTAYLTEYAARFALPVRTSHRVDGVFRDGDTYLVTSGRVRLTADNVVVANGAHNRPSRPAFSTSLDPATVQMHSRDYRSPAQLAPGGVLIVGGGNSGADIALDVAGSHRTFLSGNHPGHLPFRIERWHARIMFRLVWLIWSHVLTHSTPWGRSVLVKAARKPDPLIRVKPTDLDRAGVIRVPRTVGVVVGQPELDDGRVLAIANVIWCTGFHADYRWLGLDRLDTTSLLPNIRGVVTGQPGLYILGQEYQHAFNSHTIGGVARDAAYIAQHIQAHRAAVTSDITKEEHHAQSSQSRHRDLSRGPASRVP